MRRLGLFTVLAGMALWLLPGAGATSPRRHPPPGHSAPNSGVDSSTASRDPFAPAVPAAGQGREASPLERFAIGELRLVATVDGVVPPRALIEDPNGLGFIITPGTVVGAEGRKVVRIGGGRIVLEMPPPLEPGEHRQMVIQVGQRSGQER